MRIKVSRVGGVGVWSDSGEEEGLGLSLAS